MSLNVDAWLAATASLGPIEYLVVHRLLCHSWRAGAGLHDRPEMLARLVGVSLAEFERARPIVAAWFTKSEGGLLVNEDLELERARARKNRDDRRRGAEAMHRARAAQHSAQQSAEHGAQHGAQGVASKVPQSSSQSPSGSAPDPDRHARREELEKGTPQEPLNGSAKRFATDEEIHAVLAENPTFGCKKIARLLRSTPERVRRIRNSRSRLS